MKKSLLLFSLAALGLLLCSCNETWGKNIQPENDVQTEKKIKWEGSIDEDFKDDEIFIVIDKNYTDKSFTENDFPDISIDSIRQLTSTDWRSKLPYSNRVVYQLVLKEKSKQKVIDGIEYVQTLDFVKRATPNKILQKTDSMELESTIVWNADKTDNTNYIVTGEYFTICIDRNFYNRIITPNDFPDLEIEEIIYDHRYTTIEPSLIMSSGIDACRYLQIQVKNAKDLGIEGTVRILEGLDFVHSAVPMQSNRSVEAMRDTILLYIKEEYKNREYDINDFLDLDIEEFQAVDPNATDIYATGQCQLAPHNDEYIYKMPDYCIRLADKGRENLAEAIEKLKAYENIEFAGEYIDVWRDYRDVLQIEIKEEYKNDELTIADFPNLEIEEITRTDELNYTLVSKLKGTKYLEQLEKELEQLAFVEKVIWPNYIWLL